MEQTLQIVLIVFMIFLCLVCAFAIFMLVRDIVRDGKRGTRTEDNDDTEDSIGDDSANRYRAEDKEEEKHYVAATDLQAILTAFAQQIQPPPPPPQPEPQSQPVVPQPVTLAPQPEDENAVTFSSQSYTMEEKYSALSTEYKRMFDDVVRHALNKPNVKEYKHNGSYDYKDGSYRVVRMTIRRGEIVCEFSFINRDFLNYASASNVKMKQSSTTVRIQNLSTVGVVKDGIDLVCTQIAQDREYKREQARARRREKRRQQNAQTQPQEESEVA